MPETPVRTDNHIRSMQFLFQNLGYKLFRLHIQDLRSKRTANHYIYPECFHLPPLLFRREQIRALIRCKRKNDCLQPFFFQFCNFPDQLLMTAVQAVELAERHRRRAVTEKICRILKIFHPLSLFAQKHFHRPVASFFLPPLIHSPEGSAAAVNAIPLFI